MQLGQIVDILGWAGMSNEVWVAFATRMGDPDLDSLAIIAGLVTVIVGLSIVVVDIAIDRSAIEAERTESERIINQLTKRLYWLELQLEED